MTDHTPAGAADDDPPAVSHPRPADAGDPSAPADTPTGTLVGPQIAPPAPPAAERGAPPAALAGPPTGAADAQPPIAPPAPPAAERGDMPNAPPDTAAAAAATLPAKPPTLPNHAAAAPPRMPQTPPVKPPAPPAHAGPPVAQTTPLNRQTEDQQQHPSPGTRSTPVMPPPTPALVTTPRAWEEREPSETDHPVPHLDASSKGGVGGWRIVGASRRGKMHAHEAKYREDAWCAGVSDEKKWNIIAVADGGGSYTLARLGARVAAETAVNTLIATLPEREFIPDAINGVLAGAMDNAYLALEHKAQALAATQPGIATRDLSTTLLILAHCPDEQLVCVAQVGDGLIALQKENGEPVKLAEGDSGQVAGEVIFLNNVTSREWRRRIKQYKLSESPRFLVAMTDGVADDVVETDKNFRILFQALSEYTRKDDPAAALLDWLNYEKRGSFDDRTLAVIYPE